MSSPQQPWRGWALSVPAHGTTLMFPMSSPFPPAFPIPRSVTGHPLTENSMAQTSSDTQWGGNCHNRRADRGGGNLRPPFHQKNAAPNVLGSICAPWLSLGPDACLNASTPRSRQDLPSGQSFPELLWICVEEGSQPGTEPGSCLACTGQAAGRRACGVASSACPVSLQAAGPVPGAEGVHAVPPGGGLLPGPGAHRRRPAHAHAGRGTGTRLRGRSCHLLEGVGPFGAC